MENMTTEKLKRIITILNKGIEKTEKECHYSGIIGKRSLVKNATLRAVKKALEGDTFILKMICE